MERWLQIYEFPRYSVSNHGRVRNDATGRIMSMVRNAGGVLAVYLVREGRQYSRGVAKLVAEHFLPHSTDMLSSPIHLDGDRLNNDVRNLMWRPRQYVPKFMRQFEGPYRPPYIDRPIQEMETGVVYPNSWAAVTELGIVEYEIAKSYHMWHGNGEIYYAHPTRYHFRAAD